MLGTKIIPGRAATFAASSVPIDNMRSWPYHSAEYGCQDLLAFSSYCDDSGDVFVLDMNSMQLVQTLHRHNAPVTCVQWHPPPVSYLQHGVLLITGDRQGVVVVWDVAEGVALGSVRVPNAQPVCALSFLWKKYLFVLTRDGSSFVYDLHLAGRGPLEGFDFSFCSGGLKIFTPLRMCTSKLSATQTCCVVLGDRVRVVSFLESGSNRPHTGLWAKDLIYDSEDGYETVLDATFSEAQEDVLYFATRTSIGAYDWKLSLLLNEQVLWLSKGNVEFRRIFPSSPCSLAESEQQIPFLYSFGTDQRLCAWYVSPSDKVTTVTTDVRGARIMSKTVANVVQSPMSLNLFAVVFVDGSVARWRFLLERRRWSLEGYFSFALSKPTTFCVVGENVVCCALENGYVVLIDVLHNVTLRRINIVHSGGTRIVLLSPHRWGESVWVVTNKTAQSRHYHQVTLLDCRSGVVLQILRKPDYPNAACMKDITLSPKKDFLLLAFFDGTCEVWNVEKGSLIHSLEGMGVVGVSWAPRSFPSCPTKAQGDPELLALFSVGGTLGLWTVYQDRVVPNRDAVSLFPKNPATQVLCAPVDEAMLLVGGVKVPSLVRLDSSGVCVSPLQNVPSNVSAITFAVSQMKEGDTDTQVEANLSSVFVALLFADGSFGVWRASNQNRLGYSIASQINLRAQSLTWREDKLLVLTTTGDIAILGKSLASVNSNVSCKFHRRPLQTSAFFLPAHRTYIQTVLETQVLCSSFNKSVPQADHSPSYLVTSIDSSRRPCRGPLGQVITSDIATLAQELDLYKDTMIPKYISDPMRRAVAQGRTDEVAFWVARFLGQQGKQRLWLQFSVSKKSWRLGGDVSEGAQSGDQEALREGLELPFFYSCCDHFSEAVANSKIVCKNRLRSNGHRIAALEATKNHNVDVSKCRLAVARELLRLQEPQKAIDVLMDANYENDQFTRLADLAVAIAASVVARDSPSFALFERTTKHLAAMCLAKGDLDSSVEKFVLSGDYYEAGLALQSSGKWNEAAVLAKVGSMTSYQQREILFRWCTHCAKRGETMEAVRIFLSMALPCEAIVLLSESTQLTDIAGLLTILLLTDSAFSSPEFFQQKIQSPLKDEDPSSMLSLGGVVSNTLADYCKMLSSVGNVAAERIVLELIASLKRDKKIAMYSSV